MLGRISRIPLLHRQPKCVYSRRNYAESSVQYHRKVRALPFAFSEDDAITHIGVTAALTSAGEGLLSALAAKYLPALGKMPVRPERIQAIYYPAWIVDAEFEAKAWLPIVSFENSLPVSNPLDFLGKAVFRDPHMNSEHAVPFSSSLLKQRGSNIICLPFKVDPFFVLDKLRGLSSKQAIIEDDLRFEAHSLSPNLFAVYPVLIPLYIAQYKAIGNLQASFCIQAHSVPGRFFLHFKSTDPDFQSINHLRGSASWVRNGKSLSFADPRILSPEHHDLASVILQDWIDDYIVEDNLPSTTAINMKDLRIREWNKDEVQCISRWVESGEDVQRLKDTMRRSIVAELGQLKHAEKLRASLTPPWWREWEGTSSKK
ncbi:hypothetical protein BJ138DRAFT_1146630 [Hygrophoropsis aurantiaca]|uniref:Uncharacterized protein n=1 Tax=Hygrophoropsis aurantiaca TaxID=72124 RepID=A0ACB8AJ30_9AGAM|nr:hypothetical protein BJ138DRAFT_1146630 [Hygrophoropsis aurantiaca]